MKSSFLFIGISILTILIAFSCKKLEDPFKIENVGEDYFPLSVGKYIEYEVDSMVYSLLTDSLISETKTYVREEIVDTLLDNLGNTLFKVERFTKKDSISQWEISKVLTQAMYDNQAFRTEDNLKYIPLVFPIRENKSWNGNVFIDVFQSISVNGEPVEIFKEWSSHRMRNIDSPETIGTFDFENVLSVTASNSSNNNLEQRLWTEKYVKGIGLVYRELWILDTQCESCCGNDLAVCDALPWEEKAEKGFILKQVITDHN